jgi:hypothetical protein
MPDLSPFPDALEPKRASLYATQHELVARHDDLDAQIEAAQRDAEAAARADDEPTRLAARRRVVDLQRERAEVTDAIDAKTLAIAETDRLIAAAKAAERRRRVIAHAKSAADLADAVRERVRDAAETLVECVGHAHAAVNAASSIHHRGLLDAIDGPGLARFVIAACTTAGLSVRDFQHACAVTGTGRDPVDAMARLVTVAESIR